MVFSFFFLFNLTVCPSKDRNAYIKPLCLSNYCIYALFKSDFKLYHIFMDMVLNIKILAYYKYILTCLKNGFHVFLFSTAISLSLTLTSLQPLVSMFHPMLRIIFHSNFKFINFKVPMFKECFILITHNVIFFKFKNTSFSLRILKSSIY